MFPGTTLSRCCRPFLVVQTCGCLCRRTSDGGVQRCCRGSLAQAGYICPSEGARVPLQRCRVRPTWPEPDGKSFATGQWRARNLCHGQTGGSAGGFRSQHAIQHLFFIIMSVIVHLQFLISPMNITIFYRTGSPNNNEKNPIKYKHVGLLADVALQHMAAPELTCCGPGLRILACCSPTLSSLNRGFDRYYLCIYQLNITECH